LRDSNRKDFVYVLVLCLIVCRTPARTQPGDDVAHYAAWMDGALESDIGLIRAAMEGSAAEPVPSPVQRNSAAQVGSTLTERLSNTECRLPREGAPVAEFGTRFVTRCGTLATQVPEEEEKLSGGEGGIARGRGRPLVLRFAPDRRGEAATSKNRSAIFVEPTQSR
jgi:hypothetical protein